MEISCIPASFFPQFLDGTMDIPKWARLASGIGYDGIDISTMFIKNHTPVYLDHIKQELEKKSIPVVMVVTYPDFTHPDNTQRKRELEYLSRDIAVASQLGARYVRILAGQVHQSVGVKEGIAWVVENFKKAAEVAEKYSVQLVYENHSKPGAWHFTDFSYPPDIFLDIVEKTEGTNIGINFDTANVIAYGSDTMKLLGEVINRVVTIHAADTATKGELNHTILGTGLTPFSEIFSFLKQHKFDNWICVEEGSNTGELGLKKALEFVRKEWGIV